MVDKYVKAIRMQRLKDLGIRKLGQVDGPKPDKSLNKGPSYLVAHACFSCRVSFKKAPSQTKKLCPKCRKPLSVMGRSFKAPRKHATDQWKKVERLWYAGFRFPTNTGNAAGYPERLTDVDDFIRNHPRHPFRLKDYWL